MIECGGANAICVKRLRAWLQVRLQGNCRVDCIVGFASWLAATLAIACWSLVIGSWSLVICCWLLSPVPCLLPRQRGLGLSNLLLPNGVERGHEFRPWDVEFERFFVSRDQCGAGG